jgi:hypothetical protein
MGTIGKAILAAAVVLAVFAGGCGSEDSCPSESPQVTDMPAACTATPGQTVSYPLQLCPTCNQTFTSCDVQMSGTDIFLNPLVEACESASSCAPGCNTRSNTCTIRLPVAAVDTVFTVSVFDPASGTMSAPLTIVAASPVCAI